MTVMLIIAIIAVMLIPSFTGIFRRGEKVRCMANLRTLYFGANHYVQDHNYWPQINPALIKTPEKYAAAWQEALAPFGVSRQAWICPTVQHELGNPDYNKPETLRTDYIAMPFDPKPRTPYLWPSQPWFLERGDVRSEERRVG